MIRELIHSQVFLIFLTLASYVTAQRFAAHYRYPFTNPILLCMVVIIAFLELSGISFAEYYRANAIFPFLLNLSVVALGYLLFQHIRQIRENLTAIVVSITLGAVVGGICIISISRGLGAGGAIVNSLRPYSVTTPIALSLSEQHGGIPAITSAIVIFAGLFGAIIGPSILQIARIESPLAKGLALGSASHGFGTARAMEYGALEGAAGGLAIGITGIITSLLLPIIEKVL